MNFLRKYYVPGLISLIFLPIAFIFFAVDKIKIPKQYVQEHMPLSSKDSNRIKEFTPKYFSNIKREYIISSDELANKNVLKEALDELNQLAESIKPKAVIRFKILDEAPLQEFVNLFDWLYENDIKRYAFIDNYLYIASIPIYETVTAGFANCVVNDPNITQYLNPNIVKFNFHNYWTYGKELILLYFIFLLSIILIKKKYLQ